MTTTKIEKRMVEGEMLRILKMLQGDTDAVLPGGPVPGPPGPPGPSRRLHNSHHVICVEIGITVGFWEVCFHGGVGRIFVDCQLDIHEDCAQKPP